MTTMHLRAIHDEVARGTDSNGYRAAQQRALMLRQMHAIQQQSGLDNRASVTGDQSLSAGLSLTPRPR